MNNITSSQLARASTLAGNLETLRAELVTYQTKANDLRNEIEPLESEFNTIMGVSAKACKRADGTAPTRQFSQEQKDKIAAGLKASWARRKAAASPAVLSSVTSA